MKKVAALLALALAAVALVACGGDDDDGTTTTETSGGASNGAATQGGGGGGAEGGGSSAISFEADPGGGLAYTSDTATGSAGKDTIEFKNPQAIPHDVVIEDASGEDIAQTETITESSTSTTADLKAGEYTFYCSVPGHREAGMEGKLTVK